MAGGKFAEEVVCLTCSFRGVVTRAERTYEGVEDDHYVCDLGHEFGMDWRYDPPTEPQWPPSPELAEAIREMAVPGLENDVPERRKVPDTTVRRFVYGCEVRPAEALLAWLESTGERRLRLPVVLVRGPIGFQLHEARIGDGADALRIRCSDSALGIGLDDRAQHAAGAALMVALWLEGHWRGGEDRVFAIIKVGERIEGAELTTATVEIEAG